MKDQDQIKPFYIDPERNKIGIIVSGGCHEVTKESLQDFCKQMLEILSKDYDKYTYIDNLK